MSKKLYKSETDKMLFGVCGGLGEYFDISSTLIRILWVIAILCFGTGFLVYFILFITYAAFVLVTLCIYLMEI
ncbi:PspC domain-containing protein [Bacillus thuringiensis]|nr:PspC domain-containing protein [Bacillus thuringiensis]MRA88474.1 PspC domain-containing protein [Bacillus thuringiensis]MRC51804.1 PspC domain-containing protein [Bacillus thuringiensis]